MGNLFLIGEQCDLSKSRYACLWRVGGSASSGRVTSECDGWGGVKEEGVFVKQTTISFDFFCPLGNGGQLTFHNWLASFLCAMLCLFSAHLPETRHMKIKWITALALLRQLN